MKTIATRTKATKELERMFYEKQSGWALVVGPSREIYRRFSTEIWAVLAFSELAFIVFVKIG